MAVIITITAVIAATIIVTSGEPFAAEMIRDVALKRRSVASNHHPLLHRCLQLKVEILPLPRTAALILLRTAALILPRRLKGFKYSIKAGPKAQIQTQG